MSSKRVEIGNFILLYFFLFVYHVVISDLLYSKVHVFNSLFCTFLWNNKWLYVSFCIAFVENFKEELRKFYTSTEM